MVETTEIMPVPSELKGSRTSESHTFRTSDGVDLVYRAWPPSTQSIKAVVLFHRGHEHSARWQDFVDTVDLPGQWMFAWDARGHGKSPGDRGYAESFARMVRDADEFVRHISELHGIPIENISVVAQSVGAVLAATWVHDYAPPIRALVLATPAFRVKLYVPLAIPGLRLLNAIKDKAFIKSYVKPRMLTHDPEQAAIYAADKEISPQIAVNILLDLYDTSTRLIEDAGAIHVPTLMLVSGNDWVVSTEPQRRFFDRLSSRVKEWVYYPDFYHSTFWERDRHLPIERTREFLLRREAAAPERPDFPNADRAGYTRDVYDRLQLPLPLTSPKRSWFALQHLFLNTLGRLSESIKTGWRTGFDSGESLDHVYRNTPAGKSFIGRFIDRVYLQTPGWTGIRTRKVHMEKMLDRAIAAVRESRGGNGGVHIIDIASGPGRYVLEAMQRHPEANITAVCRDRDTGGLEAGRRLAASLNISSVEYRAGDAFDGDALAAIEPQPDVAIVSGLYELFPSNEMIRDSLRGLGAAVREGGYLVYTNQPWHPQQEMIARVLPNRDGDPWVMRCRTQAEMDALVAEAGFKKIDMLIDNAGIFTVSLAKKKG